VYRSFYYAGRWTCWKASNSLRIFPWCQAHPAALKCSCTTLSTLPFASFSLECYSSKYQQTGFGCFRSAMPLWLSTQCSFWKTLGHVVYYKGNHEGQWWTSIHTSAFTHVLTRFIFTNKKAAFSMLGRHVLRVIPNEREGPGLIYFYQN
jgi:hypothetical protein